MERWRNCIGTLEKGNCLGGWVALPYGLSSPSWWSPILLLSFDLEAGVEYIMAWFNRIFAKPYLRCPTCNTEEVKWGRLEWTDEGARLIANDHVLPKLPKRAKLQAAVWLCPAGHPVEVSRIPVHRSYSVLASVASGKTEIVRELYRAVLPDLQLGENRLEVTWRSAPASPDIEWPEADQDPTGQHGQKLTCRTVIARELQVKNDDLNEFLSSTGATRPDAPDQSDSKNDFHPYDNWGGTLWPFVKRIHLETATDTREAALYIFDLQGEVAYSSIKNKGRLNPAVPGQVRNILFVLDGAVLVADQLTDAQLAASTRPVDGHGTRVEIENRISGRRNDIKKHLSKLNESDDKRTVVFVLSKSDAIRTALSKAKAEGKVGLDAWASCFGLEVEDILEGAKSALTYLLARYKGSALKTLRYESPEENVGIDNDSAEFLAKHILCQVADPSFFWAAAVKNNRGPKLKIIFPADGNPLGDLHDLELPSFEDEFFAALRTNMRANARDLIAACIIGGALSGSKFRPGTSVDRNFRFALHCAREVIDDEGSPHPGEARMIGAEKCSLRLLQLIVDNALKD